MDYRLACSIMGVNEGMTVKELSRKFKSMAKIYHPDNGGSNEKMKELNEAYRVVKDRCNGNSVLPPIEKVKPDINYYRTNSKPMYNNSVCYDDVVNGIVKKNGLGKMSVRCQCTVYYEDGTQDNITVVMSPARSNRMRYAKINIVKQFKRISLMGVEVGTASDEVRIKDEVLGECVIEVSRLW